MAKRDHIDLLGKIHRFFLDTQNFKLLNYFKEKRKVLKGHWERLGDIECIFLHPKHEKKTTKTYMGNLIICTVTNVLDASIFIKGSSFFHFQDLDYLVILLTVCQTKWCYSEEFGIRSTNNFSIDIFLYSHPLSTWYRICIARINCFQSISGVKAVEKDHLCGQNTSISSCRI